MTRHLELHPAPAWWETTLTNNPQNNTYVHWDALSERQAALLAGEGGRHQMPLIAPTPSAAPTALTLALMDPPTMIAAHSTNEIRANIFPHIG